MRGTNQGGTSSHFLEIERKDRPLDSMNDVEDSQIKDLYGEKSVKRHQWKTKRHKGRLGREK